VFDEIYARGGSRFDSAMEQGPGSLRRKWKRKKIMRDRKNRGVRVVGGGRGRVPLSEELEPCLIPVHTSMNLIPRNDVGRGLDEQLHYRSVATVASSRRVVDRRASLGRCASAHAHDTTHARMAGA
jgi:hypothetical protein